MNHLDEKDLLARALRERAGDVTGQPVSFQAVRGSARRVQRRRRMVTGAVAAAVATVALPTGIAVNNAVQGPSGPDTEPQFAATPAQEPTASSTAAGPPATPNPDGTFTLTTQGLPQGEQTRVEYIVRGTTLVTPEEEVSLGMPFNQMVPFADGWLGLTGTKNGWEHYFMSEDMTVERTTLAGAAVVPNTEGTRVLTSERDFNVPGRTVVLDTPSETDYDEEQRSWDAPRGSSVRPVGYLDEGRVVFEAGGDEGEPQGFVGTYDDGSATVPLEGFVKLTASSEVNGLIAAQLTYDPADSSCWGVFDPDTSTSEPVWRTCDYSLHEFSPDGRYVIASAPDFDSWGPVGLTVLDVETWEPVVEFAPERNVAVHLTQATWEDADTVVAAAMEGDRHTLVRAELDGRLEAVSETYPARDMSLAIMLADRPSY